MEDKRRKEEETRKYFTVSHINRDPVDDEKSPGLSFDTSNYRAAMYFTVSRINGDPSPGQKVSEATF